MRCRLNVIFLVLAWSPIVTDLVAVPKSKGNSEDIRITVELNNGTRFVGTAIGLDHLPIRVDFGNIQIPPSVIQQITSSKDNQATVIRFKNGDQLTGHLILKQLKLKTRYGIATLPTDRIKVVAFSWQGSPANVALAGKWFAEVPGTYRGVIGAGNDPITITFTQSAGKLVATYTITDPQFSTKPYKGTLADLKEVAGKERTLKFRYRDAMNNGYYVITFSKDLKQLTGTYEIDGDGQSSTNTVTATKL